jgi:hypothetical protein
MRTFLASLFCINAVFALHAAIMMPAPGARLNDDLLLRNAVGDGHEVTSPGLDGPFGVSEEY